MQRVLALPLVRIWQSPAMVFGEFIVGGGSPTFKVTRPPGMVDRGVRRY